MLSEELKVVKLKLQESKNISKIKNNNIIKNNTIDGNFAEMVTVCLVSAFAFVSIASGSLLHMNEKQFVLQQNLAGIVVMLIIAFVAMIVIFNLIPKVAKLIMLLMVFSVAIISSFVSSSMDWNNFTNNIIGHVCFMCLMGVLIVMAFWYVKDDLYYYLDKIKFNNKGRNISLIIAGLFIFTVCTIVGLYRYWTYSTAAFDFGIFVQMFEHMKQTGEMRTLLERGFDLSHYAIHFSPIFYIVLPIYAIFPYAETLVIIQSVMVTLPLIPIALLCKHFNLDNRITVSIGFLYVLFPLTSGDTFFDFHENCFLTFLLLMFIWAVEKKKDILGIVFLVLLFCVKEDVSIYILVYGAFLFVSKRDRKRGLIMMAIAVIWYVIVMKIINDLVGASVNFVNDRYSNLLYDENKGIGQIVQQFLTNPLYVISQIISNQDTNSMSKIKFILFMFVPICSVIFTSTKKYSRYILFGSIIFISLINNFGGQHQFDRQYYFGGIALLIYLILINISEIEYSKQRNRIWASILISAIMCSGLVISTCNLYITKYYDNKEQFETFNEACALVPDDVSVRASSNFTPQLARNIKCLSMGDPDGNVQNYPEFFVIDSRYDESTFKKWNATNCYINIFDKNQVKVYKKQE